MASYYAIIDVRVDDSETYAEYGRRAKPIVEKHGGEYLVRGGDFRIVEGDTFKPRRLVILRFPDRQAFEDCYNSPEYQAARELRLPAADMTWIGVEGFDAT